MTTDGTAKPPAKEAYEQLTARQRRFVDLIVQGRKRAEAVRAIGYKGNRPNDAAYNMLQRPLIRQAVAERDQMWMEGVDVSKAMIATELARVGMFDPRRMVDENGAMRPLRELDDDTAAAIQSVEIHEEFEDPPDDEEFTRPRTAIGRTVKVRVAGKVEALRELAAIYRMKGDENQVAAGAVGPGLTVIIQQGVQVVQAPAQAAAPEPAPVGGTYEQFGLPPPELPDA